MGYFLLALVAGMVTIGGPCILPLLPIVLGTSAVKQHPLRPVAIVVGFTAAFTAFALAFSTFGGFFGLSPQTWRYLAAAAIAVFGVLLLFPELQAKMMSKLGPVLASVTPRSGQGGGEGLAGGFLLGLSLGLVWTPCAGPVLGSILTIVASRQDLLQAGALLFAFSLGAGIPMLAIAYGGQAAIAKVRLLARYAAAIQRTFGALIILVAIGLVTQTDVLLQAWLLERYPWLFVSLELGL